MRADRARRNPVWLGNEAAIRETGGDADNEQGSALQPVTRPTWIAMSFTRSVFEHGSASA